MLYKVIMSLGGYVCHQKVERSFQIGNSQLPLCARCSGIYWAFAFIFLLCLFRKHKPAAGTPPLSMAIAAGTAITLMQIDGLTSYMGLRTTSNAIRFATGTLTGWAISLLMQILLALSGQWISRVRNLGESLFLLYLCWQSGYLLLGATWSWWPFAAVSVAGVLLFFWAFNNILAANIFKGTKLPLSIFAGCLMTGELLMLAIVRRFI